jgi:hypothetical protein
MESSRGSAVRRSIAAAVVAGGAVMLVVGLRADHLELGHGPGRSWKSIALAIGGCVLAGGLWAFATTVTREDLRRWLRPERVAPFVLALAIYGGVYAVVWDKMPPWGDEPHYMLEASSLVIDHDRNLAPDYSNPGRIAPYFGSYVPSVHAFDYSGDPRVAISMHGVGLPLILAPVAAVSSDPRLFRIEMILLAAATAYLLLSLMRRVTGSGGWLLYAVWASVVFSLPMLSYSSQVYPELPGAFLVLLALRLIVEPRLGRGGAVVAATAASALPWLHFRFGLLSLVLIAVLLVRTRGAAEVAIGVRERIRRAAPVIGPFLLSAGLFALAQHHWYGSFSPTAASKLQKPPPKFDLSWAWGHSLGGVLDPAFGWLPFAPLHLLAFVGVVYLALRGRRWIAAGGGIALVYLFLVGSAKPAQGGFSYPARYQLILIPLAAIPLFLSLRDSRAMRTVAVPLAALTLAIAVVGVARIDRLIYRASENTPALPFAHSIAGAWPQVAEDGKYRDWPQALAYVALIVGAGSLLAFGREGPRVRTRRPLAASAGPPGQRA